ncbi:MAG: hypothetical protein IPN42_18600 [Methylococcaceae bacterium]|nr:hypothetical protein [Methylococcaceae bacterium]
MHKEIYQKVLFHLSLFGVAMSILVGFYDVIFGYLMEFVHLLFEVVEISLDRVVEHFFETELHETQMIVFYILLVVGGFLIFFIYKALVLFWRSVSHGVQEDWFSFKSAITTDWQAMSTTSRIIWIGAFILVNYLASFFLF